MKLNTLKDILKLNFFDESEDSEILNRYTTIRIVLIAFSCIASVIFAISCISVFFTDDIKTVLYALIGACILKLILGLYEYSIGMKATGLNSMCMSLFLVVFGLICFSTI
jgi:hypothetical protein